jgi:hypothetical protein
MRLSDTVEARDCEAVPAQIVLGAVAAVEFG